MNEHARAQTHTDTHTESTTTSERKEVLRWHMLQRRNLGTEQKKEEMCLLSDKKKLYLSIKYVLN